MSEPKSTAVSTSPVDISTTATVRQAIEAHAEEPVIIVVPIGGDANMAIDGYCLNLQFEEIGKLLHLLGKCGNNLNQYAKRANGYGEVYRQDMKSLQKAFFEMRVEMKQILGKLTEIS